ncbi:SGNH/GDSL hydrolase family protein [Rossellomorea aquimaris]|uniref:SGNH/GDSL hydrolase family protein n=1 Tax=Rossellomorea aquimaris TaxID=189382 RepID=A0A1J6VNY6_9BACI|nr:SGNH/GDSL hydrolase family protein [Rossellomorea aquimaris]OIU67654.1 hypothetical protein BHE18_12555 [Rossellomorea aquimaris]
MKNFLLIVFGLICVGLLYIGNQYWQERIAGAPAAQAGGEVKEENAPEPAEAVKEEPLISNWPAKAQDRFKEAVNAGNAYRIALVGSDALGSGNGGWSDQLKEELSSGYGDQVEVSIFEEDTTSVEFLEGDVYEDVLAFQPDLVLFEPFTLTDNSIGVPVERNHESILTFYEELQEENSSAELILQPSYPIEGATYYPKQVDGLKTFAGENDFTYLDHWAEWPEEEELGDYLLPSQEGPNEQGHELWADYLMDYFIAE